MPFTHVMELEHVSIRAPRAGGDAYRRNSDLRDPVSIRAPRAGGDGAGAAA